MKLFGFFGRSNAAKSAERRGRMADAVSSKIVKSESRRLLRERGKYSFEELRKAFKLHGAKEWSRAATTMALDSLNLPTGDSAKRQNVHRIIEKYRERRASREAWNRSAVDDPYQSALWKELVSELGSVSKARKFRKHYFKEMKHFLWLNENGAGIAIEKARAQRVAKNFVTALDKSAGRAK